MSARQLLGNLNESTEDAPESTYDNTPLQEQVEQQDTHIFQLEDALSKSVDVIAALMGERADLADQVYQAQMDAQDWQNRYNAAKGERDAAWKRIEELHESRRPADAEQIRELTAELSEIRQTLGSDFDGMSVSEAVAKVVKWRKGQFDAIVRLNSKVERFKDALDIQLGLKEELTNRVHELTDENTRLELRNEVQARRLNRIMATVRGQYDNKQLFVRDIPED